MSKLSVFIVCSLCACLTYGVVSEAIEDKQQSVWNPTHSHRSRRELNWNTVIDVIIRHSKDEILKQDKNRIPLPDVHEDFKRKKGFLRIKGHFQATGGWMESFASLTRLGDVSVRREGSAVLMTATLGLSDLRVGYSRYEIEVFGHGPDGTIEGRIGKNAIKFVIKFDLVDGECQTSLVDAKITEFDDFNVNIAGLGSFDWLGEKIVEWLTNKRKDDIKSSIEKQVRNEVEKGLEEFYCDEYASLYQIPI